MQVDLYNGHNMVVMAVVVFHTHKPKYHE